MMNLLSVGHLLLLAWHLFLVAWHLLLLASCYLSRCHAHEGHTGCGADDQQGAAGGRAVGDEVPQGILSSSHLSVVFAVN